MLENPNGVRVSPANIGFGTGIKSFVMIRERGGLYLGGFVDLSFGGYTNRIGYPDEKTGSNSQFNLCSNIGYRWLLGSDFTLSLGAYSGLSLPLSGIYSHKNQPGKVYIDNGNVYPLAAIEIMVSKQW